MLQGCIPPCYYFLCYSVGLDQQVEGVASLEDYFSQSSPPVVLKSINMVFNSSRQELTSLEDYFSLYTFKQRKIAHFFLLVPVYVISQFQEGLARQREKSVSAHICKIDSKIQGFVLGRLWLQEFFIRSRLLVKENIIL